LALRTTAVQKQYRRNRSERRKAGNVPCAKMKLAEMIHKALTDQHFRLALESGTAGTAPGMAPQDIRPDELEALHEVMRGLKGTGEGNATKHLLDDIQALRLVPDWRED